MTKPINPSEIMTPYNNAYHHGVEVPFGGRTLYVSGQVGMTKGGAVPDSVEEQGDVVWQNLKAILRDAGMEISNIVKMNTYVVGKENFPGYAAARTKHLGGHTCASTLVMVDALVTPELKVEVEIVAVG